MSGDSILNTVQYLKPYSIPPVARARSVGTCWLPLDWVLPVLSARTDPLIIRAILSLVLPSTWLLRHVLYRGTPVRLDGLALGGWLAMWVRTPGRTRAELRRLGHRLVGFGAIGFGGIATVACLVMGRFALEPEPRWMSAAGYALLSAIGAGLILFALDGTTRIARVLENTPLRRIGGGQLRLLPPERDLVRVTSVRPS